MNRTLLVLIGILAALLSAAGLMWYNSPLKVARRKLHDTHPNVRCWAIRTLGDLGDKESAPEIVKLLLTCGPGYMLTPESAPEYRIAAEALGELGDKEAIPYVTKSLYSEIDGERAEAVLALRYLKAVETIPEIKKLLNDEVDFVRDTAEGILKSFGVPDSEIQKAKENK